MKDISRLRKNATRVLLLLLLVGVGITGCDLNRYPTNVLRLENSLENYDDAVAYNRGVMAQFRNRIGGTFAYPQEYMADCFNALADWGLAAPGLHGWRELNANSGTFATCFQMYYSTLKNVNFTIENYHKVKETLKEKYDKTDDEDEKAELKGQMDDIDLFIGTACFARAYYYYNFLLRFGIPYNAATADTDLGVPLVTTYDVSSRITRNTVRECYDQVFKDLELAEKELVVRKPHAENSEFTVDAVKALKARIYLERKEYDKAYATAMELIQSGTYPLVEPTKEAFEDMWVHDTSSEEILILEISLPDEEPNGWGSYYGLSRLYHYHSPAFIPTKGLLDKYEEGDLRYNAYFYLAPDLKVFEDHYKDEITIMQKFKGNPEYTYIKDDPTYGRVPSGFHKPRVFRIAEQYLIAAEAGFYAGKDALMPLNALRASRGLKPVTTSGDALINDIRDERLRELVGEGFRLWDLRRWNLPVKRMAPQKVKETSNLKDYLADGYYDLDVEPGTELYKKIVWAIPQYDINVYGEENLKQNPGW